MNTPTLAQRLACLFAQARLDPHSEGFALLLGLGLSALVWAYKHPDPLLSGAWAGIGVVLLGLVTNYLLDLVLPGGWCGTCHGDDEDEGPVEFGKAA